MGVRRGVFTGVFAGVFLVALGTCLTIAACTSDTGLASVDGPADCPAGGVQSSGAVAADRICERVADLQCSSEGCCCDDTTRKYATHADCVAAQLDACMKTAKTEEVTGDPRSGYDANAAGKAMAAFAQYANACDPQIVQWGVSATGLASVMRGTIDAGKACWTPSAKADPAAFVSCKNGYACLPDPGKALSAWKCKPRAKVGETCLADASCADGLRCEPNLSMNITQLGRCMTRLGTGSACKRGLECKSVFCDQGKCAQASVPLAYCLAPAK